MTAAVQPATPAAAAPAGLFRWMTMFTVMTGLLGSVMSSTMANIAIPDVMGAFGIGQDRAHWMSSGFLAAMTVSMLLNAWVLGKFGARHAFIAAMLIFSAASILGEVAPTYEVVVAARVIQGACAGVLQPMAMSVIFLTFRPHERGVAMGLFGMGVVIGPALGPTIGGFIVDHLGWRYVFTATLPLPLIATAFAVYFVPPRDPNAVRRRLNWQSLLLMVTAVTGLLNGLSNGQRLGWESVFVTGSLLVAAVAGLAFVVRELSSKEPLVNLELFASRTYAASAVVSLVFGAGFFGSTYLLPIFVQTVSGFTALKAGLMLLPAGLAQLVVFPLAGRLAQHVRPGWPILFGLLAFAVSTFEFARADFDTDFWTLALWLTLGRIGLGFVFPSLSVGSLQALRPELVPYGAGTLNFTRMLGAAVGVNVLAVIVDQRTASHATQLTQTQTWDNQTTQLLLDQLDTLLAKGGLAGVEATATHLDYLGRVIMAKANWLAFQDGFLAVAVAFVVAMLLAVPLTRAEGRAPR
ncbi:MAG: DHA2 family efflux MFS transporter permease subunit [Alphaproteobacteria bacterium]|nr:DHA2 family efflux MFS transporter permease subunit [Alphaproteobacteria bacterium]